MRHVDWRKGWPTFDRLLAGFAEEWRHLEVIYRFRQLAVFIRPEVQEAISVAVLSQLNHPTTPKALDELIGDVRRNDRFGLLGRFVTISYLRLLRLRVGAEGKVLRCSPRIRRRVLRDESFAAAGQIVEAWLAILLDLAVTGDGTLDTREFRAPMLPPEIPEWLFDGIGEDWNLDGRRVVRILVEAGKKLSPGEALPASATRLIRLLGHEVR